MIVMLLSILLFIAFMVKIKHVHFHQKTSETFWPCTPSIHGNTASIGHAYDVEDRIIFMNH